jgi:acyl carrier protein
MAFEEEFKNEIGGEIPESEAENLKTVGDVSKFIESKLSK